VKYGGGQQNTLGTDEKPKHRANDKMRSCSDRDEQIRQEIDMKAKFSDLTQSKGEEQTAHMTSNPSFQLKFNKITTDLRSSPSSLSFD
jgi:hypothetical protein